MKPWIEKLTEPEKSLYAKLFRLSKESLAMYIVVTRILSINQEVFKRCEVFDKGIKVHKHNGLLNKARSHLEKVPVKARVRLENGKPTTRDMRVYWNPLIRMNAKVDRWKRQLDIEAPADEVR